MMKINWFECDLVCYDSLGLEIDITELPAKIRKEIAAAIVNGNKCGSFSDDVVNQSALNSLDPTFSGELISIARKHQAEVERRQLEREERIRLSKLIDSSPNEKEKKDGRQETEQ